MKAERREVRVMASLAPPVEYLGRHVQRCARRGELGALTESRDAFEVFGDAKIAKADDALEREEDVGRFHVPVDNGMPMAMLQCERHLHKRYASPG